MKGTRLGMRIKDVLISIACKLPDAAFLKLKYAYVFRQRLNLEKPVTFNEKIQYLKLFNQRPEYTKIVDKFEAKSWVESILGGGYTIPLIAVYDSVEQIEWDRLPKQFVLKTTHDSGSIVICTDSATFDRRAAAIKLKKSLERDSYLLGREWPYKNVKRRIIAEEYMVDDSGEELKDYKVFCFNGEPKMIQLDYGRFKEHHRNMYSVNWRLLPFEYIYSRDASKVFAKPNVLPEMLQLARRLSKGIPFVRTDFYIVKDRVYFGEMTFFPESGYGKFRPDIYDRKLGELIKL